MTRREKTEFILQQVALCIEKGDWTQAGILSRKIGTKYFTRRPKMSAEELEKAQKEREEKEKARSADDPPVEPLDDVTDLKLRYYEQQITLAKHEDKYLEACKHYRQVLDTEAVEEDPKKLRAVCYLNCEYLRPSLTISRYFNVSSITSFLPRTTTNSLTSSTVFRKTPATRRSPRMHNWLSSSPCPSS
jgi:hypothetical protein